MDNFDMQKNIAEFTQLIRMFVHTTESQCLWGAPADAPPIQTQEDAATLVGPGVFPRADAAAESEGLSDA